LLVLLALVRVQTAQGGDFTHDFRTTRVLPPELQPFGPEVGERATFEPEGLRIRLPAQREQPGAGVGVHTRFVVSGDFEITLSYDLLAVEKPARGRGSGVSLYLEIGSPWQAAATLARVTRVKEGESYVVWRGLRDGPAKGNDRVQTFPAKVRSGKLRLTRTGSSLRYSVAEGDAGVFRGLAQVDFITSDVDSIRFAANTGESPTALDIRLHALQIRAAGLPTGGRGVGPDNQRARGWLFWMLLLGAATLVVTWAGLWLWQRSRTKADRRGTPLVSEEARTAKLAGGQEHSQGPG
jgi:hypothetical protein